MNMGFIKNIYVLTLVIIIIIFNDHKSDANYCIYQITGNGNMGINFNGQEAFEHAYRHLIKDDDELKSKKYILNNYFENHLSKVFMLTKDHLNPLDWKKKYCSYSSIIPFMDYCDTFDHAKNEAYLYMTEEDFKDNTNKGYYEYILSKLLPLVPRANIHGPFEFCKNYTVLTCESQIRMIENINIDFTGKEAFIHIYYNFDSDEYNGEQDILHQYTHDLYNAVVSINIYDNILDPTMWCIEEYIQDIDLNTSEKEKKCNDLIIGSYFYNEESTKSALIGAYYKLQESYLDDDFSTNYYFYMIRRLLSSDKFENAISPKDYCEIHFQPFY